MTEAHINVASGFNGGVSVSLRADSAAEFEALLADVSQSPTLSGLLTRAGLQVPELTETQALQNIQAAFPATQPVSTVGQPLPQPQAAQPAQTNVVPLAPPNVPYPGDCTHGRRVYVDKPAKGRAWRRWECANPWKPGAENAAYNAARCKPDNVDN